MYRAHLIVVCAAGVRTGRSAGEWPAASYHLTANGVAAVEVAVAAAAAAGSAMTWLDDV